ncbi:hypothetical protein B0H10DRAFT_2218391 [Mycena sp. CBHHK59/15]|nr:hypothetical protein B0H10DRAFT_2218391 [Mycena sp. CBHHK59/15]
MKRAHLKLQAPFVLASDADADADQTKRYSQAVAFKNGKRRTQFNSCACATPLLPMAGKSLCTRQQAKVQTATAGKRRTNSIMPVRRQMAWK